MTVCARSCTPVFIFLTAILLTGCGMQKTAESTFEKASDECSNSVAPGQFIVKKTNGSIEVVKAAGEREFINGYLTENLDSVEFAENDFVVKVSEIERNVQSSDNTIIADNWGAQRIHADHLWQQNVRGEGVVVAVVDTGVDIRHPQLANQIYTNPGETGTDANGRSKATNGVDDDGNGYVDDVHGWNFVNNRPLDGDNSIHGTHVAGIIAADHADTAAGPADHVQGVAPKAKILPLAFLDRNGAGMLSSGVKAIQYAVAQGARVINASWGGDDCSKALREEIRGLDSTRVAFIAAAGNDSRDVDTLPSYPASLNLAAQITVGAIGSHDIMANYSNYGVQAVHIFAPGTEIDSTLPNSRVGTLSGTSMATPFVAGAVALLLSSAPTATVTQVRAAFYRTAFHDNLYLNASHGRIDLTQALDDLKQSMH